jgi:hypothetical protein
VKKHEVEIGVRRRLAPSKPPDGNQGDTGRFRYRVALVASRRGERAQQRRQPRVVRIGQRISQRRANESGLAKRAGPDLIE